MLEVTFFSLPNLCETLHCCGPGNVFPSLHASLILGSRESSHKTIGCFFHIGHPEEISPSVPARVLYKSGEKM